MGEKTPLLISRVGEWAKIRYYLFHTACVIVCLLLNFSSFIPPGVFNLIPSEYRASVEVGLPFVCEALINTIWVPLEVALQQFVYISLKDADDASLRAIRKSDSLNALLKGVVTKILPTSITIFVVLKGANLPSFLTHFLTVAIPFIMAAIAYFIFVPMAACVQQRKGIRDDYVENARPWPDDDAQTDLIASMKTNGFLRTTRRNIIVFCFVIILFLRFNENPASYIRLGHYVISLDETLDKMAQSFTKAMRILAAALARSKFWQKLLLACVDTSGISCMPLQEVLEVITHKRKEEPWLPTGLRKRNPYRFDAP